MHREGDCGCGHAGHHEEAFETEQGCGCGGHGHHAGRVHAGCGCHEHQGGMGFRRRFISREEIAGRLEEYLRQLQAEAKGVEERISEIKKAD